MTDNEMKFLLTQWGEEFTTAVIKDIATNVTKTPNDSIVLAVALKHANKRIDELVTLVKALQTGPRDSGFDVAPIAPVVVPPK